jgi:hypothetical protein
MSIRRSVCLAVTAAAYVGLASPSLAFDARHHAGEHGKIHSGTHYRTSYVPVPTICAVGTPIATQTRAKVHYIVPVIPTLLGIRPAPVGQPVIYVIDQPDEPARQRVSRGRASESADAEGGPRILRIEP